jgi:hypothetical protein
VDRLLDNGARWRDELVLTEEGDSATASEEQRRVAHGENLFLRTWVDRLLDNGARWRDELVMTEEGKHWPDDRLL